LDLVDGRVIHGQNDWGQMRPLQDLRCQVYLQQHEEHLPLRVRVVELCLGAEELHEDTVCFRRGEHVELDVEWAAQRVHMLVHAEGLAHPLAHELLLEHDGLGRVHDGWGCEDRVVALDTVHEVPDFRLHRWLEPPETLLELGPGRRRLARELVLQGQLAQREHVGDLDRPQDERRVRGVELPQVQLQLLVELRQRVIERGQQQVAQAVALRAFLPAQPGDDALQPKTMRARVQQAVLPVVELLRLLLQAVPCYFQSVGGRLEELAVHLGNGVAEVELRKEGHLKPGLVEVADGQFLRLFL
jgi:hypothetical protein